MKDIVNAVIWKEFRLFIKQTCLLFILFFGGIFYGTIKILKQLGDIDQLNSDIISIYLFIYILAAIMISGAINTGVSTTADIREGTLNPVLASVNRASDIWLGQFLFSYVMSLSTALAGLLVMNIIIKLNIFSSYQPGLRGIMLWLIFAPATGAVYVALNLFLTWVIRYTGIMLVTTLLVPGGTILLIMSNITHLIGWDPDIVLAMIFIMSSVLIVIILKKLTDMVPKENYIGKV